MTPNATEGSLYQRKNSHPIPDEIFQDPEIDIVIELLGGIEPATTFMLSALENGKHVVTANKAALAANYHELMDTAKDNNVILQF